MLALVFTWLVLILALVLAAVGLIALVTWHGSWRWLALIAILPIFVIGYRIVVDVAADPTSHNLWPFEMLIGVVLALSGLGALQVVRLLLGRSNR